MPPEPGTILVFAIIFVPVYSMIGGWFGGKPRDAKTAFLGIGYVATFIASLWGGLFALTLIIDILFFSGGPLSGPLI